MKDIDKMLKYLKGELKSFESHARKIEREPLSKWVSAIAKANVQANLAHIEQVIYEAIQYAEGLKKP